MASLATQLRKFKERLKEKIGSEERERFRLYAAAAGTLLLGSSVAAAYKATTDANALQRQREAITAAGTEIAQQPYITGQNIGATGEIQISESLKSFLPIALAFIVVMYLMFKD